MEKQLERKRNPSSDFWGFSPAEFYSEVHPEWEEYFWAEELAGEALKRKCPNIAKCLPMNTEVRLNKEIEDQSPEWKVVWKQKETIWERKWSDKKDYVVSDSRPNYLDFEHTAFRFVKFRSAVNFILRRGKKLGLYEKALIFKADMESGTKVYKINENDPILRHLAKGEPNCKIEGKHIVTLRDCEIDEFVTI